MKEELNLDATVVSIQDTFTEIYKNKGRNNELYNLIIIVHVLKIKSFKNISPKDDVTDYKFFSMRKLPKNIAFPEKEIFLKKLAKKS